MARSIFSFIWFASTLALAGVIIVVGAIFTVQRVADAVDAAPVKVSVRPSYIASFPPVRAAALDISKSVPVSLKPAVNVVAVKQPAFTHEVAVNSLAMRSKPTKHSAKVANLSRGAQLSLINQEGKWALVTGPDGKQGWVYTQYLQPAAQAKPAD